MSKIKSCIDRIEVFFRYSRSLKLYPYPKNKTYVLLPGVRKDIFAPVSSSPGSKIFRGYQGLPVNDGIIWKHSSQYSGLMSIYLQGVCLSLPFYLSKHIWCPVADASNRNVCFPEDAYSLFIQFCTCCMAMWCQTKETSCDSNGDFSCYFGLLVCVCVCSSHSDMNKT